MQGQLSLLDQLRAAKAGFSRGGFVPPSAVAPRMSVGQPANGCNCGPCGKNQAGGPSFVGYSSAGSITVVSTGAGSIVPVTVNIQGRIIPRDSVIQLATSVTVGSTALARITNLLVDGQPIYIGTNGIFAFALDMGNQQSLAQRLGLDATRNITIEVTFGPTSNAGDTLGFSIGRRGELAQQTAGCDTLAA